MSRLWMQAVPTLVAKEGAAGVMAAGLADGRAVAFKIADGSDTARQAVVPAALRAAGLDVDAIAAATVERVAVPVLGHGERSGVSTALEWAPMQFLTLDRDSFAYGAVRADRSAGAAGHRREPVEVHLPRHRHLHRRW